MKYISRKGMLLGVAITLFVAGIVLPSTGSLISPWDDPNQPNQTHYWEYNFDDGILFPTVSAEGGNWDPGTDPAWTVSGSGDFISIVGGQLGGHAVTRPSLATIRLDVPNTPNPDTKFFWFAYDFFGSGTFAITPSAGTTNLGHTVSGITYTANTAGNHVEGYITIDPQPQDEWLKIDLTADLGGTAAIDNLQVGSVCIPEPSTFALLMIASLVIGGTRRAIHRRAYG